MATKKKPAPVSEETEIRLTELQAEFDLKKVKLTEVRTRHRFNNRFAGPDLVGKAKDIKRVLGILAKMANTEKRPKGSPMLGWRDALVRFDDERGRNNVKNFLHSAEKVVTGVVQIATSGKRVFGRWGLAYQNPMDSESRAEGFAVAEDHLEEHGFVELTPESLRKYHILSPGISRMIPRRYLDQVDPAFVEWRKAN